jgi:ATP-dependent Zn protease
MKLPESQRHRRRRISFAAAAYHEAGHGVAAHSVGASIGHLSIDPDQTTLGRSECVWSGLKLDARASRTQQAREVFEKQVLVALGGVVAQRIFTGKYDWHGAEADVRAAHELLSGLAQSDNEHAAYFKWLLVRAEDSIQLRWKQVDALAQALLTKRNLSGSEVRAIVRSAG